MGGRLESASGEANAGYLAYHTPRFHFLLDLVQKHLPPSGRRALDIGPSPFTDLLRRSLPCPVDTLGLEAEQFGRPDAVHHHVDLNAPESLPDSLPRYDLIVFAEVLEHLHTSPTLVLSALRRLLHPGGVLVLQTPNAASLPKRLKLLAGRNPFELIREDRSNPGHFREYTLGELLRFAEQTEFDVLAHYRRFYFDARYSHHENGAARRESVLGAFKNAVYRGVPPFLREGITVVLSRGG